MTYKTMTLPALRVANNQTSCQFQSTQLKTGISYLPNIFAQICHRFFQTNKQINNIRICCKTIIT